MKLFAAHGPVAGPVLGPQEREVLLLVRRTIYLPRKLLPPSRALQMRLLASQTFRVHCYICIHV